MNKKSKITFRKGLSPKYACIFTNLGEIKFIKPSHIRPLCLLV